MEGRERSRPDGVYRRWPFFLPGHPFNGGAGTFPPGPNSDATSKPAGSRLQWRGGNVPARTRAGGQAVEPGHTPSMEGRERSRPDRTHHARRRRRRTPFNGGAGTFPPGLVRRFGVAANVGAFNGGAGTFPPGLLPLDRVHMGQTILQWRGGNVPARTCRQLGHRPEHGLPSMEGRERSRPDMPRRPSPAWPKTCLQWRGGNVPART